MDTTTLPAFWEGIASTGASMVQGNQTFWSLTLQIVLIISLVGAFVAAVAFVLRKALASRSNGRKRY